MRLGDLVTEPEAEADGLAPSGDPVVVAVACTAPNDGRIVAVVKVPLPCPPQSVNIPLLAENRSLCLRRPPG